MPFDAAKVTTGFEEPFEVAFGGEHEEEPYEEYEACSNSACETDDFVDFTGGVAQRIVFAEQEAEAGDGE